MNILQQSAFDIDLNINPLWCAWFSGWIDGEGSFTSDVHNINMGITSKLTVEVRDDDSQLVYNVKNTLRCGQIYRQKERHRENLNRLGKSSIGRSSIKWMCRDIGACRHILVPLFDCYPLQSKKKRDYDVWRQLVFALAEGQHVNGNRAYVLDLCQKLKDVKKYIPPTLVDA